MRHTNINQTRIVINPTDPTRGVKKSDLHGFFVNELVPKQLTIENSRKGGLMMRDANDNLVPFSVVVPFSINGVTL
jgi:hypothetical protein